MQPFALGLCRLVEESFAELKFLPQYRFVSRPIYKWVASHSNVLLATAVSFVATDLILHQIGPAACICALSLGQECSFSYSPSSSLNWLCVALPVMIAKYHKIQNPSD